MRSLLKAAAAGDVQAAKVAFDRLCDSEPERIALRVEQATTGPPVPRGGDLAAYVRKLGELARELGIDGADDGPPVEPTR